MRHFASACWIALAALLSCGGGGGNRPDPVLPVVAVSVNPTLATLHLGQTQAFTATVTGAANTTVTWSVVEATGGSIMSAGLYTAPGTAGTYHVLATSAADTTKSGQATVTVTATPPVATDPRLYPVGDQMPVGLYSSDEGFEDLLAAGWNLFHTYTDSERQALALKARNAGVSILGSLPGISLPESGSLTSDELKAYQDLARTGAVSWWDLPEERDWSKPEEMRIVEKYAELIRSGPQPLPTYMYIPGDYDAQEVSKYLPYLDIVPAAVYPCYANQPYAWSRWRMETTVKGIIEDKKTVIGKDYRAGQKTPVAVLELFYLPEAKGHLLSAEGAYHDFWQVLVSGAQGILVYSYFHRNDDPSCLAAWASLQKAKGELLGTERLDRVLLWGTPVSGLHASVVEGPTFTRDFVPIQDQPAISVRYDSVDFTARQVGRTLYVVVVNSAEQKVTVKLSGLPSATQAEVLFRDQHLPVSNGTLDLENLEALGVRILKIQLD